MMGVAQPSDNKEMQRTTLGSLFIAAKMLSETAANDTKLSILCCGLQPRRYGVQPAWYIVGPVEQDKMFSW